MKRYSLGCSIDNVYDTIFTGYPTFVDDGLENGFESGTTGAWTETTPLRSSTGCVAHRINQKNGPACAGPWR